MRLTIQNYKNLEGTWDDIIIDAITETHSHYYFGCHFPNDTYVHVVPLSRDSALQYGYHTNIFYFVGVDGNTSQGVTPEWLEDKGNAKKTITDEFLSRYNHKK